MRKTMERFSVSQEPEPMSTSKQSKTSFLRAKTQEESIIDFQDDELASKVPVEPTAAEDAGSSFYMERPSDDSLFWKIVLGLFIMLPWTMVRILSAVVNKWQNFWQPVSWVLYGLLDLLDQHSSFISDVWCWLYNTASLALHWITVAVDLAVIHVMYKRNHSKQSMALIFLYLFSHYCMAIIMFKELDHNERRTGARELARFFQRLMDVLFYDAQLMASVIHSNKMLQGVTQLLLKGYEESRVALAALMFTMPCCIILGVEYKDGFRLKDLRELRGLHWRQSQDQVYAAMVLSVLNSIEKLMRLTLADPWMHDGHDGFPLLYVRSNAARVPAALSRDWLFRCRVMLREKGQELVLKDLYGLYTHSIKDKVHHLCDSHKAYLFRKAMYAFGSSTSGRGTGTNLLNQEIIVKLQAKDVQMGPRLCTMIANFLASRRANNVKHLDISSNQLDDGAVTLITSALEHNDEINIECLDASDNDIEAEGVASVARMLGREGKVHVLTLARNPLQDEGGVALAEALKANVGLFDLDCSHCRLGATAGEALGEALKYNTVLGRLNLAGTKIGSKGCSVLIKSMKVNQSIRELNLSHISLDDKVAEAIAHMLMNNKTLETLNLSNTNITDKGAQHLLNALEKNSTLQILNVADNMLMDKSWQKLLNHCLKGKMEQ